MLRVPGGVLGVPDGVPDAVLVVPDCVPGVGDGVLYVLT